MLFSFAALLDYWRVRLTRIENQLSMEPYDSWRLRLERRVISFCLHRHASGPAARPPSQAVPLDPAGAARSRRLWLRDKALPEKPAPSSKAPPFIAFAIAP